MIRKREKASHLNPDEETFFRQNGWHLKSAFERVFDNLKMKNSNEAALFYISLIACYKKPSLPEILSHISIFYGKPYITRTDLLNARDELIEKGIIATILFTHDNKLDFAFREYLPNDPLTIFEETFSNLLTKELAQEYLKIINDFSNIFYKKIFNIERGLLKDTNVIIAFNSMWPIYFMLAYSNHEHQYNIQNKRNILLLLHRFRFNNDINSDLENRDLNYLKLFKYNSVRIILQIDEEQNKDLINSLIHQNIDVEIRSLQHSRYTSSRRIIVEDVFAIDLIKIINDVPLSKNMNNSKRVSYMGVLYTNEVKKIMKKSFDLLWAESIVL